MVCFNYEKPGHLASECRQKKNVTKTKVKNAEYYMAKYLQAKAREQKNFITGEVDRADTSSKKKKKMLLTYALWQAPRPQQAKLHLQPI